MVINKTKDSTTTLKVVCAMLFIAFVYSYVNSFQPNLLEMTQYAWADGKTHYDHTVGTIVIILTMMVVSFVTAVLTSLPQRVSALVYFPAMLFMGLFTSVELRGNGVTVSDASLLFTVIALVIYVFVVRATNRYKAFLIPLRSTTFLSQPWWTNILVMVLMACMTYAMGNTDRTLHTRLNAEHYATARQWEKVKNVGIPQYDNDSSLTMIRALALANTNEMGERLFTYELTGGSKALFPKSDHSVCFLLSKGYRLWQTIGVVPRNCDEPIVRILKREIRRGTVKKAAYDYLLCAYLLDRDLSNFARELPLYYTVNDSLPQHYGEALVLYNMLAKRDETLKHVEYVDAPKEADFADFMDVRRKYRGNRRASALRDAYFGTYWYYYYK